MVYVLPPILPPELCRAPLPPCQKGGASERLPKSFLDGVEAALLLGDPTPSWEEYTAI